VDGGEKGCSVKLDVVFTPAELGGAGVGQRTVVVIDVLRATSTVLEALVNGARDVLPVESVEQAVRKAQEIGRDQAILCGERDVERIGGFELGNSPLEFVPEKVAGRTLVMTTTNGTRAILLGSAGNRCLIGSYLNAHATAAALAQGGNDALLLCAGREGRFALEDAVCAGIIARETLRLDGSRRPEMNDAARAAALLARRFGDRLPEFLPRTAAGRHLVRMGRRDEVEFCATRDRYEQVPRVQDRRITL
jgi:2-phosphosulfolactate phosphatase